VVKAKIISNPQISIYHKKEIPNIVSAVALDGVGAMLHATRLLVRAPIRSLNVFSVPNPSSRTMALGFTQPLTEMSSRRYIWG
jgi:hypothetical protein